MTDLPSYQRPPVNEVAVGIHYVSDMALGLRDMFRIHSFFEDRYPGLEEYPLLPKIVESADQMPSVEFAFVGGQAILPRLWFVGVSPTEIVQLQRDRLVVNWRKMTESDTYLRFDAHVKPAFIDAHRRLVLALDEMGSTEPAIERIEVAYVNAIIMESGDTLATVLRPLRPSEERGFLPEVDGLQMQLTYKVPQLDGGSLLIGIGSATRKEDGASTVIMQLTVRAKTDGTFDHALQCIDVAREWIVRGFTDMSTDLMHERWVQD